MLALIAMIVAFVVGAISVVAAEAAVLYFIVRRIIAKSKLEESVAESTPRQISGGSELILFDNTCRKQGVIWILEPEKVPKISPSGEPSRRREFVEVVPVPKSATLKGKYLTLTEIDGSRITIKLKGCKAVAVSASGMSKRYPIKIESKNVLYGGSKILYIYLETSWEKESWCKALRVASCDKKETVEWFSMLSENFDCYLRSLTEGYTSFAKPSSYQLAPVERTSQSDTPPSKVRLLWKKLAKKASKSALERKMSNSSIEDSNSSSKTKSIDLGSQVPDVPDTEADEKVSIDEGTLCWNLLISRLFFDAKSNMAIKNSLKDRIQRTLSNMRTSIYIGAMTCTDIDTGNLPPHIRTMRVVPMDMKEMWAFEMDVEYSGDMVLYIEVRLDVHDKDFQDGTIDPNVELNSADGVATDILQEFEHFGEKLNCSDETASSTVRKSEESNSLESDTSFKNGGTSSTSGSRWKSIMNSVAKHVAQVPFMLAIRVASLRGTMQLRIKPPPSDQLWFTFTSMPDIDFRLESFVGEHKITSAHTSLYLVNRFKAAIRDTLVYPNCESLCIPWMLAEKEDWVPKTVAPFTWLKHDVQDDSTYPSEVSTNIGQPNELPTENELSEEKENNPQDSKRNNSQSKDDDSLNISKPGSPEHKLNSSPHYVSLKDQQDHDGEEDDGKSKRMGRKARMIDLGRKISVKIEEKSRHIMDYSKQNSSDDSLDPSVNNSVEPGANSSPSRKSLNELNIPLLQKSESPEHLQNTTQYLSLRDGQNRDSEEEEGKFKRLGRKARMLDLGRKMGEKLEEKSRKLEEKSRNIDRIGIPSPLPLSHSRVSPLDWTYGSPKCLKKRV
ncbi:hypothetical protein V2J09_005872 [Rumex salicifolius]